MEKLLLEETTCTMIGQAPASLSLRPGIIRSNDSSLVLLNPEPLIISAVSGEEILAQAQDVFLAGVDKNFRLWRTDRPGRPSPETAIDIYEMVRLADFPELFSEINPNLDRLCFTQHQIKEFFRWHGNVVLPDYGMHLLFEERDQKFLVRVRNFSGYLDIHIRRLGWEDAWKFSYLRHLAVPRVKC